MKTIAISMFAAGIAVFSAFSVNQPKSPNLTCQICFNTSFVPADKIHYIRFTDDQEVLEFSTKHRWMCQHCGTFSEVEAPKK